MTSMTPTPHQPDLDSGTSLTKEEWIRRAADKLKPYRFPDTSSAQSYAETLHQVYVVEEQEFGGDPEGAVEEDMSYWGD